MKKMMQNPNPTIKTIKTLRLAPIPALPSNALVHVYPWYIVRAIKKENMESLTIVKGAEMMKTAISEALRRSSPAKRGGGNLNQFLI